MFSWIMAGGMATTSGVAMWYQVRYYKLVDELIDALSPNDSE